MATIGVTVGVGFLVSIAVSRPVSIAGGIVVRVVVRMVALVGRSVVRRARVARGWAELRRLRGLSLLRCRGLSLLQSQVCARGTATRGLAQI